MGNGDLAMSIALWVVTAVFFVPMAYVGFGLWASSTLESPREF